jgi:hypothetical protein
LENRPFVDPYHAILRQAQDDILIGNCPKMLLKIFLQKNGADIRVLW